MLRDESSCLAVKWWEVDNKENKTSTKLEYQSATPTELHTLKLSLHMFINLSAYHEFHSLVGK